DVKDALEQVKQGAGDVAQAALKSVESKLAGLKDYVAQTNAKVAEAAQEALNATQEVAREALAKAHEAAAQVAEIAGKAIQHATDAYDAVKAAAQDAVHTVGDQLSPAVQGHKSNLMFAAETVLDASKAGMTLAQAGIAKGKSAIEMCAASAAAGAKSLIDGLESDLGQVIDAVNCSADAARKEIEDAIDQYGRKWIKSGLYIGEHGEEAFKAGKSCFEHIESGLALVKDKKWEEAGKEADPAQQDFETAKSEVQLCIDKLEEVEMDIPDSVKETLQSVIDNVKEMLPEGESSLTKFIEAVKAKVGQVAAKAKEACEKAKK